MDYDFDMMHFISFHDVNVETSGSAKFPHASGAPTAWPSSDA